MTPMQVVHLVAMNYSQHAARAASATLQGMSNSALPLSSAPLLSPQDAPHSSAFAPGPNTSRRGNAHASQRLRSGAQAQSDASVPRYSP